MLLDTDRIGAERVHRNLGALDVHIGWGDGTPSGTDSEGFPTGVWKVGSICHDETGEIDCPSVGGDWYGPCDHATVDQGYQCTVQQDGSVTYNTPDHKPVSSSPGGGAGSTPGGSTPGSGSNPTNPGTGTGGGDPKKNLSTAVWVLLALGGVMVLTLGVKAHH